MKGARRGFWQSQGRWHMDSGFLHTSFILSSHFLHTLFILPSHFLHTLFILPSHSLHTSFTLPSYSLHTSFTLSSYFLHTSFRLDGYWTKWNNNAGYVKSLGSREPFQAKAKVRRSTGGGGGCQEDKWGGRGSRGE